MNYKELPNAEKLAEIADCNFFDDEIALAEEYAFAVADGNMPVIEDYESYGDSPRQLIMNKKRYARAVSVFGFTEKRFNEHGWLADGVFMDCEEIFFNSKDRVLENNRITLGRSPNHRWTYGIYLTDSIAGQCFGLSVFNPPYNSREACLIAALEYFTGWHQRQNNKKTAPILKQVKDMLDVLTGRKPVQLSLF